MLAIINGLNRHADLQTYEEEFTAFRNSLSLPVRQTHLLT